MNTARALGRIRPLPDRRAERARHRLARRAERRRTAWTGSSVPPRRRRAHGICVIALAGTLVLIAGCSPRTHHTAAPPVAPTSASQSAALSRASTETRPAVGLPALGQPTVSAACGGGAYRQATSSAPLNGLNVSAPTGFELTGSNCNTSFTWALAHKYSRFAARVFLSLSDSGAVSVSFSGDGHPLPFTADGAAVTVVHVSRPVQVSVETSGVDSFTITLPNNGQDAGILDFTDASLTP